MLEDSKVATRIPVPDLQRARAFCAENPLTAILTPGQQHESTVCTE
jgi:hypothetical protein